MKSICRYVKGSLNKGVAYNFGNNPLGALTIKGYTNLSFADELTDRRSYLGYVFTIGKLAPALVTWLASL